MDDSKTHRMNHGNQLVPNTNLFGNVHDILCRGHSMGGGDWSQLRDDEDGLTAVIEFLSASRSFS